MTRDRLQLTEKGKSLYRQFRQQVTDGKNAPIEITPVEFIDQYLSKDPTVIGDCFGCGQSVPLARGLYCLICQKDTYTYGKSG